MELLKTVEEIRSIIFAPLPFDVNTITREGIISSLEWASKGIPEMDEALEHLAMRVESGDREAYMLALEHDRYVEEMEAKIKAAWERLDEN